MGAKNQGRKAAGRAAYWACAAPTAPLKSATPGRPIRPRCNGDFRRPLEIGNEDASMTTPTIAQKGPFKIDVVADKDYWWCACGQSKSQPFCDGSHKGSAFSPRQWKATESKAVYFCGCKQSNNKPFCDGTHSKL
jgi:CDGSH-type Zn-finger protein